MEGIKFKYCVYLEHTLWHDSKIMIMLGFLDVTDNITITRYNFLCSYFYLLGFWIMGWCRTEHSKTSRLTPAVPRFWKSSSDCKRSCGCGQWRRRRWTRGSNTSFRHHSSSNPRHSSACRGGKYQLTVDEKCLCKSILWDLKFLSLSCFDFRTHC